MLAIPRISVGRFVTSSGLSALILGLLVIAVSLFPVFMGREGGGDQFRLERMLDAQGVCNPAAILGGGPSSYGCSAEILSMIGANITNAWVYGLILNALLFAVPLLLFDKVSVVVLGCATLWAVVRALFLFVLSKELLSGFVVLFCLLMLLRGNFRIGYIVGATVYGGLVRVYWLLSLAIWAVLDRLHARLRPYQLMALVFLAYIGISVLFTFVRGTTISSIREESSGERVLGQEGSKTLIIQIIDSDNFILQALDAFIVFIRLMIPIEAVALSPGVPQLMVAIITPFTLFLGLSVISSKSPLKEPRSLCLAVFAFVLVQGLFEPDYGSFSRHFSIVTPFVFAAIGLHTRISSKRVSSNTHHR